MLPTTILLHTLVVTAAGEDVSAKFSALAQKRDRAAVVELWRANPEATLSTIDQYLEGSLAKLEEAREAGTQVDKAEIRKMREAALFGASAADETFGTSIFSDYATAFAGLNEEQQKSFRRGQAAFKEAQALLRDKNPDQALVKAKECRDLAQSLGDWWGMAMGLGAMGRAHEALEEKEAALAAFSQAALINHDLRLWSAELQTLLGVARTSHVLGRKLRAELALGRAKALAEKVPDPKAKASVEAVDKLMSDEKR